MRNNKTFLKSLCNSNIKEVKKSIKKGNVVQLTLANRLLMEVSVGRIPISQETVKFMKKKRKYKLFKSYFASEETFKKHILINGKEQEVLFEFASALPMLLKPIFK